MRFCDYLREYLEGILRIYLDPSPDPQALGRLVAALKESPLVTAMRILV